MIFQKFTNYCARDMTNQNMMIVSDQTGWMPTRMPYWCGSARYQHCVFV